jgi:hypothetical protein
MVGCSIVIELIIGRKLFLVIVWVRICRENSEAYDGEYGG